MPSKLKHDERLNRELFVCHNMQKLPLNKKSKIFDDCVKALTNLNFEDFSFGNKKSFTKAMLAALCNQNQKISDKFDMFGLHETYLIFSIRALFEKLYEFEFNPDSDCTDEEKQELGKDILHNVETLEFLQIIASIDHGKNLEAQYNDVAADLITRLGGLTEGAEYTIATGWQGHAVCMNFIRCKSGIAVCINNPQPIERPALQRFHQYKKDQLQKDQVLTMRQAVIGVIPMNDLRKFKTYFASIVRNVHNQANIDFEQGIIHLYFNEELKFLKIQDDELTKQLPMFEAQAEANCFVQCHQGSRSKFAPKKRSYILDFAARLNDEAFGRQTPIVQARVVQPIKVELPSQFRFDEEEKEVKVQSVVAPVVARAAAKPEIKIEPAQPVVNQKLPAAVQGPAVPQNLEELGAFLDSCNNDPALIAEVLKQAKNNPALQEACEIIAALQTSEKPAAVLNQQQQRPEEETDAKQEKQNNLAPVIEILRQLPPSKQARFRDAVTKQLLAQMVNQKGPHEINLGALKIVEILESKEEKGDRKTIYKEVDSVSSYLSRVLRRSNKLNGVIFTHPKSAVPLMGKVQSSLVFTSQKETGIDILHSVDLRFPGMPKSDNKKAKLICVLIIREVPGLPGRYMVHSYTEPYVVRPDANGEVKVSTHDMKFVAVAPQEGTASEFASPYSVITVAYDYVEPALAEVFAEAPGGPQNLDITPKPNVEVQQQQSQPQPGYINRLLTGIGLQNEPVQVEQKTDFRTPPPLVFPENFNTADYCRVKSKTAQETLDFYSTVFTPKEKSDNPMKVSLPFFKPLAEGTSDNSLDPETEKLFKEKLALRIKAYTIMSELSGIKLGQSKNYPQGSEKNIGIRLEENIYQLKRLRSKLRKFHDGLIDHNKNKRPLVYTKSLAPAMKILTPEFVPLDNGCAMSGVVGETLTLATQMGPASMPTESAAVHGLPGVYRAHTGGPAGIQMDTYYPVFIDSAATGHPETVIKKYQEEVEELHERTLGGAEHPFKPTAAQYSKDKKIAESIDYTLVDHVIKHLEYNEHLWGAVCARLKRGCSMDKPLPPIEVLEAMLKKTGWNFLYTLTSLPDESSAIDFVIKHRKYDRHLWKTVCANLTNDHDEKNPLPPIEAFKYLLEELTEVELADLITSFQNNPPAVAAHKDVLAEVRFRKKFEDTIEYWKDIIDNFELFLIDQIGIYCDDPPPNVEKMTVEQFADYLYLRLAHDHPDLTGRYLYELINAANTDLLLHKKEPYSYLFGDKVVSNVQVPVVSPSARPLMPPSDPKSLMAPSVGSMALVSRPSSSGSMPLVPFVNGPLELVRYQMLEFECMMNDDGYKTHITHPWKYERWRFDRLEEMGYSWDIMKFKENMRHISNVFVRGEQCVDGLDLSLMDISIDKIIGEALKNNALKALTISALLPALQYKPQALALPAPK